MFTRRYIKHSKLLLRHAQTYLRYKRDLLRSSVRAEFVVRGRNYIEVVSHEDDQILQVEQKKFLFFFTFSRLMCHQQNFLVYAPPDTLRGYFNVYAGRSYRRGEVIARGAVDTGDQV